MGLKKFLLPPLMHCSLTASKLYSKPSQSDLSNWLDKGKEVYSETCLSVYYLKLITPHNGLGIDRSIDRIDRSGCQVGGSNIWGWVTKQALQSFFRKGTKVKNIWKFEMFKINFFRNGYPHKRVSNYISWQWLLSTALLVCPRMEMWTHYIHWEDCMTGRQWYRQYEHNVYTACKPEYLDSLRGKHISWCTQELQILC